jgi:hypothetical protein
MTRWGCVEDLLQAEGCKKPKARRLKQGTKTPKNNWKKKGKPKKKIVAKGNPVEAKSSGKSLDPRGGETAVQGGGRGKGKGKGGTPGLGHQVNN